MGGIPHEKAAVDVARRAKAHGGGFKPHKFHSGPIHSSVAGRTDHLPLTVESGSYVLPADVVGGMGEGNSIAGFKHLRRMFGGTPYGGGKTPYGQSGGPYGGGKAPYGQSGGPYGSHLATGGEADSDDPGVPIVAAGGEYVLSPHQVMFAGNGDLTAGHRALDDFVKTMRAKIVKTMDNLPGPRRD